MVRGMPKHQVTIIPQDKYDISEIALKIGDYFDKNNFNFQEKTILLKPSFVLPISDETKTLSTNTHVNRIAGVAKSLSDRGAMKEKRSEKYEIEKRVAKSLSDRGAMKVLIAENRTLGTARYAFEMVNIKKVVKDIQNVKFCYLDEKSKKRIAIKDPFIPNHIIKYPKLLLEDQIDYFISLPKLKGNNYAELSLSVKNNFGLISKKERLKYHDDRLHEHLADLELIRQPDIIVTDAIISGQGNGPSETDPVETGMLIVGTNCLAVDITCCYLIGKNPKEIRHLRLLSERDIGPLDIHDIDIINKEDLDLKKTYFIMPDLNLNVFPDMKVYKGEGLCNPGCIAFIRGYLDAYGRNLGWDVLSGLTIIVGNNGEISKEELKKLEKKKTIVYGECAKKYKKYGVYLKGCPPDYVKAIYTISKRTNLPPSPYSKYMSNTKFLKYWLIHLLQRIFRF